MEFLRLHDPLLSVLFENDEIVAIDKPYGIDTHTNDSKVGNAELIQHGLIELFEKQLKTRLHIVHRLDRTTTGVIVFAKSLEAAKKYQLYFRNREAKKTYVFVTDRTSSRSELSSDQVIVHKGAELEAKTDFRRLARSAKFELWQASPHTGRNHQIRIHAAAVGIPILGDPKYGGTPYPFLCLHDRRIVFPNGVEIQAEPPAYFSELGWLEDVVQARALFEIDRRQRLFAERAKEDQCLRLINARGGSEDQGFTLDQFGRMLFLSWYKESWRDADRALFEKLSARLKKNVLVRDLGKQGKDPSGKPRQFLLGDRGAADDSAGVAESWIACENQLKHRLRADSGQSLGLFLDLRLLRAWVLESSKGRAVLNLFAQNCGFAVAAALGEAGEVTAVEANKNLLNWGRENFVLNDLNPGTARFLCRDSLAFLEQSRTKGTTFDLIICTPPAFVRRDKGVFKIETGLEPLLRNCLACLNAGGELLFSTSFESLYIDDIRKAVLKAQAALGLRDVKISRLEPPLDFDLPGERTTLKSLLIKRGS